jgi:diketogulonate reductase-like aldo/keto reductase
VFPIPKASTPAHVEEKAGAGTFELSIEAIDILEAAFPRGPEPAGLPMI